jgi:acetyl-CoA carboxylase carboxyl transferase subunit alpha
LDEVVREPTGGAHRDFKTTAENLKETLFRHIKELRHENIDELMEKRYQRIMKFGTFSDEVK